MLLMSLLLSVITLNPAMTPPSATGHVEGYITANSISPDSTCKPGGSRRRATMPLVATLIVRAP